MYLNKHFSPKINYRKKSNIFSFFPFSKINVSKIKSKIKDNINDIKENEEKCISLIDTKILSKAKMKEKKNFNNNLENTLTNSTQKLDDNKEKLSMEEKENYLTIYSNVLFSKTFFPNINRNQRKIKTLNLLRNINLKNVNLNELILENSNKEKPNIKSNNSKNHFPFNNNQKILKSSISLSGLNTEKYKKFLSTQFNRNKYKTKTNFNLYYKSNNNHRFFPFRNNNEENNNNKNELLDLKKPLKKSKSSLNTTNFKFLNNNTIKEYELPPSNKNKTLSLKVSNKSLQNFKTSSILKSPLPKKNSFSSIYNLNDENIFLTANCQNKLLEKEKENYNSSFLSHSKNSSFEKNSELKLDLKQDLKIKPENNFSLKKQKKLFKMVISNKMNELEKELEKNKTENDKNEKNEEEYIKFMIKKCKYILKIIDEKMNYNIANIEKDYDKNEVIKNLDKRPNEISLIIERILNKKNKLFDDSKYKNIKNNRHIIYNLIDKNNQLGKNVNDYIDKLLEKI